MGQLILPTGPSNLYFDEGVKTMPVDNDMYGICERVREISPSLKIIFQTQDDLWQYVIMEHCEDGVERLVMKVGPQHDIKELDGRVITRLQRMRKLPLKERIARFDADAKKRRAKADAENMEKLYEDVGAPMLHELYRNGFADKPVSIAKAGVATHGKKRR